jgi:hypothetical protein
MHIGGYRITGTLQIVGMEIDGELQMALMPLPARVR